jgi:hypothetical protein
VASCHGASCPWGELSMGRVVPGVSCPWGELSMGRIVYGASCRGASFDGASCPWGELSWGEWSGNRNTESEFSDRKQKFPRGFNSHNSVRLGYVRLG